MPKNFGEKVRKKVGNPIGHQSVMLMMVMFSRHEDAFQWAIQQLVEKWGEITLISEKLTFANTRYYDASMGTNLRLQLLSFKQLIPAQSLVLIKQETNELEAIFAKISNHAESRPLNLDPGYLTLAKFVLATTKDGGHRLYLDNGIFAEICLQYRHGNWQDQPWTYPNYRQQEYKQFLTQCRNEMMRQTQI